MIHFFLQSEFYPQDENVLLIQKYDLVHELENLAGMVRTNAGYNEFK